MLLWKFVDEICIELRLKALVQEWDYCNCIVYGWLVF